jgi:hypothetical protein
MNFIDVFTAKDAADDSSYPSLSPGVINEFVCKNKLMDRTDRVISQRSFIDTDATELANDFTVSATLAVANNTITLTTAGSSADDAGIKTDAASFYIADEPYVETKLKLTSIENVQCYAGLLKDSNELAYLIYDSTVGANWLLAVNGSATTQTTNTGVAAVAGTYVKLGVFVDTTGQVWGMVDDVVTKHGGTNRVTSAAHYIDVRITESAATAKVATVKYLEWSFNK